MAQEYDAVITGVTDCGTANQSTTTGAANCDTDIWPADEWRPTISMYGRSRCASDKLRDSRLLVDGEQS